MTKQTILEIVNHLIAQVPMHQHYGGPSKVVFILRPESDYYKAQRSDSSHFENMGLEFRIHNNFIVMLQSKNV
jgi:hypothetical protein